MAGEEPVGVHDHAVEEAVGILAFLRDQRETLFQFRLPVPQGGADGHFPTPLGRESFIGGIVKVQFLSGQGVLDGTGRIRQVAGRVRLQRPDRVDGSEEEGLQPLLFQPVGGETAEPAVHEQRNLQAPVQGVGDLVQLSVQHPEQFHQALVQGDAHFLRPVLEGELHRCPCKGDFLVCQHLTLLLRSDS